jgi:hypothetical protein
VRRSTSKARYQISAEVSAPGSASRRIFSQTALSGSLPW